MTQFSEPCVSLDVSPVSTRPPPPALQLPLTSLLLSGRLTTILISRFLLHLQAANRKASNPQGTTTISTHAHDAGGPGSLVFERVIGSLSSSMDIGSVPGDEDSIYDEDTFNTDTYTDMDKDGDGGRLKIQVKDLGGKDGPYSGVSYSEGGTSAMEMTPLSSPRSPAEASDSERCCCL